MIIRQANTSDWDAIWPIFEEVVSAGETYPYARDTSKEQGLALWFDAPRETYVCEDAGSIVASYYIKTNQVGAGSHVCNCGYMVGSQARGRGLATTMCQHSQERAVALGYKAMQFNFVASSNEAGIYLWNKLGFDTVGRLPKAFLHPRLDYVDALVMYKWLAAQD